jgi:hypothetical protein
MGSFYFSDLGKVVHIKLETDFSCDLCVMLNFIDRRGYPCIIYVAGLEPKGTKWKAETV